MSCIRTRRLTARLLVGRSHWLLPCVRRLAARLLVGQSHGLSSCVRSLCLAARLLVVRIAPALLHLCRASGRIVSPLDFSSVGRTGSHRASGHSFSRRDYSSSGLHRLYCAYAVHPDVPSRRSTSRQSVALALVVCPIIPLCVVTTRLVAATDILRLRRATGCLGTSRGSSSTTSRTPRVRVPRHVARLVVDYFTYAARPGASARRGSSSTTSDTPRARVPRHVARPVAWFVVDYFAYAARPDASARRSARRRLLHLRRASGCLGTSHSTSRGSSLTTSRTQRVRVPRLVVDYFTYAARPGASARRAARRRLLRLRHVSGCLGTLRGLSRRSSSTTSPTPSIRVPRHVAQLVVDYCAYAVHLGASAPRAARHAARHQLLHLHRVSGCIGTSRGSSCGSSPRSLSTTSHMPRVRVPRHVARPVVWLVVDYFVYAARLDASARRSARCRLLR
jgi:hypothetical protein